MKISVIQVRVSMHVGLQIVELMPGVSLVSILINVFAQITTSATQLQNVIHVCVLIHTVEIQKVVFVLLVCISFVLEHFKHEKMIFLIVAPPTEPTLAAGCANNQECPDHAACRNRLCINPCAYDNPCAPNANCRVVNHEPVCTCPDGYIGSPETSCELRKIFNPIQSIRDLFPTSLNLYLYFLHM